MTYHPMELTFGAHKGKDLREVPVEYLRWMVETMDPTPHPPKGTYYTPELMKLYREKNMEMISGAEDELERREGGLSPVTL